jgi:hypothetical protein
MALRVFVDYNTEGDDEKGRIAINTVIDKLLLGHLRPGLPLILFDSESLEVDAVAEYDQEHQAWYGVPDWSTRRDLPPLSKEELNRISQSWSL